MAAALLVPLAVVASRGDGFPVSRVELSGGGAWLPSAAVGRVTLIDGPSEQVVGSVAAPGARPGDELSVVQSGSSAYVVNTAQGTLARVDGGTYEASDAVRFREGSDGALNVFAGGGSLYVVDGRRRVASVTDPVSLRVKERLSLAAQPGPGQSVVDAAGRLWVVDGQTGGMTWFDHGKQVRSGLGDPAAQLVVVQGKPVVVDPARARVGRLDGAGEVESWSCLEVRAGDRAQLLGSASAPWVFAAVPASGTLVANAVGRDDCRLAVPVGKPGDEFGPLAEVGDYVFVPNRSTGRVVVVDVTAGAVADTLPVLDHGSGLELLAKDGFVFYNDRVGDRAGVIRFDGKRWQAGKSLRKYNPSSRGEGLLTPGGDKATTPPTRPAGTPSGDPGRHQTAPDAGPEGVPPDPGTSVPGPGGGQGPPPPSPPPLPENTVLLRVQVRGAGSVTAADPPGAVCGADTTCAWRYPAGTRVRLELPAASPAGWRFDRVTGCDSTGTSGSARTCTLTMTRARTVQAVWVRDTRALTVTIAGTGTGSVRGQGLSCSGRRCTGQYVVGTTVTLTATAGTQSTFDGWSGCSPAGSRTCSVTMSGNRTVRATFTRQPDTTPPDVTLTGGRTLRGAERRATLTATATDPESAVTRTEIHVTHILWVCRDAMGNRQTFDAMGDDVPEARSSSRTARYTLDLDNFAQCGGDTLESASIDLIARATSEGGTSGDAGDQVTYTE